MSKLIRSVFLILLSILMSGIGFNCTHIKTMFTGAPPIKIMSFNIRYGTANDGENRWELRAEKVFQVITDFNPDILGIQEALHFQIEALQKAFPKYRTVGVGRDDGQTEGEYAAVLFDTSKFNALDEGTFWFSDTPEIPGSKHWGNEITRICSWVKLKDTHTKKVFYLYNLHLDHRSQPSREKSVELLINTIRKQSDETPFVITGDFNAGETNSAILLLKGENRSDLIESSPLTLIDTYREIHPQAREVGTFNGFKGTRTGDKIDYIFVSPNVKTKTAEIDSTHFDRRYPSDHFPVTASIRF